MNISLTPQLESQVQNMVESGLYADASDVVRESLRIMLEREEKKQTLRSEVQTGINQIESGETLKIQDRKHFKELARKQDES